MPEGQAHLQVRPFHPGRFVVDEAVHDPMEEAIGRLKAGDQELLDALLNVTRQEGGQHSLSLQGVVGGRRHRGLGRETTLLRHYPPRLLRVSKCLLHRLGVMGNNLKQRARGTIWKKSALLPIAHD